VKPFTENSTNSIVGAAAKTLATLVDSLATGFDL